MRINSGLFDGHIHTHGGCGVDNYLRNIRDSLSAGGLDGENLLAVRIASSACTADTEALLAKALMPDRLTVYCNPTFQIEGFDTTPEGVAAQVLPLAVFVQLHFRVDIHHVFHEIQITEGDPGFQ